MEMENIILTESTKYRLHLMTSTVTEDTRDR